jgi:hypothetical protein
MNILVLAIIFSVIVIGGTYYFALRMSKGTVKNMNLRISELAAALGLPEPQLQTSFISSFYSGELTAMIEGREFYFSSFTKSEKTSDSYKTEFSWKIANAVSGKLRITKEGIKSTLNKQFGGQDIEIGQKEFDQTFLVKGDKEEFAKAILTNAISAELLKKERGIYGSITIQDDSIRYEESGVLLTDEDLQRVLRLIELCKNIAKQIETF